MDAAETAGLAHDLGHPPFGHAVETELNKLVQRAGVPDGFEGNAQSFRIVTRLASSDAADNEDTPIPGLNLTQPTLDGILKYPWGFRENPASPKKWGFYETEREIFTWVRQKSPPFQRSLIAEIMDWADDITFAIHDLLDFYCAGKIPIVHCKSRGDEYRRLLSGMFCRKPEWENERSEYEAALVRLLEEFPGQSTYTDSASERASLYAFSTLLIRRYIPSIRIRKPGSGNRLVNIRSRERREVDVLKEFIWQYIILNPDLGLPQEGQRKAVRTVFRKLLLAARSGVKHLFPAGLAERLEKTENEYQEQVRFVADYIAGMTEKELMRVYREIEGRGV